MPLDFESARYELQYAIRQAVGRRFFDTGQPRHDTLAQIAVDTLYDELEKNDWDILSVFSYKFIQVQAEKVVQQSKERALCHLEPCESLPGVMVHKADKCAGQESCPIHKPSAHIMRDWPMTIRFDKECLIERVCEHGCGHPDPDSVAYISSTVPDSGSWIGIHGCCGCCHEHS